VKN
jgi:hypothetical protein